MIKRFYYTFNELLNTTGTRWTKLFNRWECSVNESAQTNNLFDYIQLQYGSDYIVYIDFEAPVWENISKPTISEILLNTELKNDVSAQIKKICSWLTLSKEKYEPLLQAFDANKNNLMSDVETTNTVQFNDTPQTTTTGLDSDEFATTYTKSKTASQLGTKIARLAEISNLIDSYNNRWVKEFGAKFVIYN